MAKTFKDNGDRSNTKNGSNRSRNGANKNQRRNAQFNPATYGDECIEEMLANRFSQNGSSSSWAD